jgi:hypothetical protein
MSGGIGILINAPSPIAMLRYPSENNPTPATIRNLTFVKNEYSDMVKFVVKIFNHPLSDGIYYIYNLLHDEQISSVKGTGKKCQWKSITNRVFELSVRWADDF